MSNYSYLILYQKDSKRAFVSFLTTAGEVTGDVSEIEHKLNHKLDELQEKIHNAETILTEKPTRDITLDDLATLIDIVRTVTDLSYAVTTVSELRTTITLIGLATAIPHDEIEIVSTYSLIKENVSTIREHIQAKYPDFKVIYLDSADEEYDE